ncbi:MAG: response regulator [Minisyncoccota bacterium]
MNIIIAEDERLLSKVLKEEFEEAGFKIIQTFNGLETLKELKAKSKNIDLVLLDLLMPVINGFQVLEEMQKDRVDNLRAIPVIVLSNLGQDEDIKKAMSLGAVDYFVKAQHPISEVVEKVKNFLEKGGVLRNPLASTTYVVSSNPSATILKNPVPIIISIEPASALVGDIQVIITVNGSGFVSSSTVQFAGSNLVTTYLNENHLSAAIPATDLVAAGVFNITVFNSIPGGGISNAKPFSVNIASKILETTEASLPTSSVSDPSPIVIENK